jgi:flagellar motor switch protein FliN
MTTTTSLDPHLAQLAEAFAAAGLELVQLTSSGMMAPEGPLSVVSVRQGADVVALVMDVATDADADSALLAAVLAAHPGAESDAKQIANSFDEAAAQVGSPLEPYVALRDGGMIGMLGVAVDRRAGASPPVGGSVGAGPAPSAPNVGQGVPDLAMLKNVSLEVTVELGRATVTLAQLMGLTIGSVIELDRVAGSPVDIRVNGMLFGRGEVVVVDDEYAVRIVEILSGGLGG